MQKEFFTLRRVTLTKKLLSKKVLEESRLGLMDGLKVKELERKISKIFNKNHGLMVNSGSSANLMAFLSLKLKRIQSYNSFINIFNNRFTYSSK